MCVIYNNFFYFLKIKNLINKFYKKNVIILKVLQIKKKIIVLEGNLKTEIFIRSKDLDYQDCLSIRKNSYIETFISNFENNYGNIIAKRGTFKKYIFWKSVINKYINKKIIKGVISSKIKGGYSISINDHKSFLPFSCSDKKISNFYYLGKKIYFIIFNININKKNIILSRKIMIKKILKLKKKIFFKNIKIGYILKGVIKNMNNYCLFIDVGYADCIIFYKNIFWGNYKHLHEFLKIGQSILGIVLKIDKIKFKVFLGIKQLYNTWKTISKIPVSYLKYARIIKVTNNHIYIILGSNLISQFSNIYKKDNNVFKVNEYKKIIIKSYDLKKKRVNFVFTPPLA